MGYSVSGKQHLEKTLKKSEARMENKERLQALREEYKMLKTEKVQIETMLLLIEFCIAETLIEQALG